MKNLEAFLKTYINHVNSYSDITYIEKKLQNLFDLINIRTESLNIEAIILSENIAIAWVVAETMFILKNKNHTYKITHAYEYIINGFFNFLKSPKYFDQHIISINENKGLCIPITLNSNFINTYINSSLIVLLLGILDIDYTSELNSFESEIIKESLMDNYFSKCDMNNTITIQINTFNYDSEA